MTSFKLMPSLGVSKNLHWQVSPHPSGAKFTTGMVHWELVEVTEAIAGTHRPGGTIRASPLVDMTVATTAQFGVQKGRLRRFDGRQGRPRRCLLHQFAFF